ncbi:MAG: hypothetical protein U0414_11395 [Polyangiaceae bacterium]
MSARVKAREARSVDAARGALTAAALLCASACASPPDRLAEPVASSAPGATTEPTTSTAVASAQASAVVPAPLASAASSAGTTTKRPAGFEGLGGPCGEVPKIGVYTGKASCGSDGRVSLVEWQLADVVGEPAQSDVTASKEIAGRDATTTLVVAGDAIWMRVSRPTARVSGSTWMGLPARMTDEQREEAQRRAGLPTEPLLKDGGEWKSALIAHGPMAKP